MDEFNLIVYFLRNPITRIVKIGKAKDFEKRYKTLCREEKCELEILLIVTADDTERQLHSYFSETRAYKNEWFYYDDRMRELIDLTKEAGHLVFPEGTPYRDLPIDQRRRVKQQNKQIDHLLSQLNQARYKRDEYKKLSSSAGYYKNLVEEHRLLIKDRKKKIHFISWMLMTLGVVSIMVIPLLMKSYSLPTWTGRVMLLVQLITSISASMWAYQAYNMSHAKSSIRKFMFAAIVLFVSCGIVSLGSILYLYLGGK